jgi:hypothetical protein
MVKHEDGHGQVRPRPTLEPPAVSTQRPGPRTGRLDPSTIDPNWTTDIVIPPRFQNILERAKTHTPGLVESRHADFLQAEATTLDHMPVQESDQVKLYVSDLFTNGNQDKDLYSGVGRSTYQPDEAKTDGSTLWDSVNIVYLYQILRLDTFHYDIG